MLLLAVGVVLKMCTTIWRHGLSATNKPTWIEVNLAPAMRRLATPHSARAAKNPFTANPQMLLEAGRHFADHCANCHGNDGGGSTEMGRNLFPRVPDLRLPATQQLTDGEIYYIIHEGIRLTGMPAWGDPGKDDDSWKLVRPQGVARVIESCYQVARIHTWCYSPRQIRVEDIHETRKGP